MNNGISVEQLARAMRLGKLGEQVVLKSKFADIVNERIKEYFPDTNLKQFRAAYGCTQSELAQKSNVSLRSIQMYEQRNKDMNKASADTVYRLSKTLGCTMEDLIEK